ncbi:MAG: hypothetical protein JW809_00905 [Pirellulales bacterium]|nr:hypothetical protein [Pirellulales bacterium]
MKRVWLAWIVFVVLAGFSIPAQAAPTAADAAFDLRDVLGDGSTNYTTSVKDQSWGTCWIHATMAAMESDLVRTGDWTAAGLLGEPDLAEYHLDKFNGFTRRGMPDDEPNDSWYTGQRDPYPGSNVDEPATTRDHGLIVHLGGDYRIAAAYLTAHGAVNETDSTRITSGTYAQRRQKFGYLDDEGVKLVDDYAYFVPRHVEFLTWQGTDEEKRQRIKESLVENGAVATCMYYGGGFISGENHYQPPSDANEPNHAVTICGWDDNRVTQAPTPGAWLCKNSWGPSAHGDGYFWISYEDKHAARHATMGGAAFRDVESQPYDVVHNHALHGWQYDTAGVNDVVEVANRYVAAGDELLSSVGLYTLASDVGYSVRITSSLGESAVALAQQDGSFAQPGFHTVDLDRPVWLDRDEAFYVVLSLTEGGYAVDASFRVYTAMGTVTDPPYDIYSSAAPNESFWRDPRGAWADWLDFDDAAARLGLEWDDASWNFALLGYSVATSPGDANLDHAVDAADAAILAAHWLGESFGWREGDFNGDSLVDDLDLAILSANWSAAGQGASSVPEPSALAGLACLFTFLGALLRKRR